MFTVAPNNASKRKKKQETSTTPVGEVTAEETDVEEYVAEKFAQKTKIPTPKQGKNNSPKGSQPGPSG